MSGEKLIKCQDEQSDFENEDESIEEIVDMMKALQPYQFEPEKEVSDTDDDNTESIIENEDSIDDDDDEEPKYRAGTLDWCSCSNCKIEEREIDCLCCQEVAALNEKIDKFGTKCITKAEEFQTLCLNEAVLENVLIGLHDSRGDPIEKKTTNRSYRYAGYKQFTWWVYKSLGRGNRRVIPSCILWEIRNMYPDPNNHYISYHEGKKD